MRMALNNAGNSEQTVEIDDLCLRTNVGSYLAVGTNGEDRVTLHCDCLAVGDIVVNRDNFTVQQHEIRRDLWLAEAPCRYNEGRTGKSGENTKGIAGFHRHRGPPPGFVATSRIASCRRGI